MPTHVTRTLPNNDVLRTARSDHPASAPALTEFNLDLQGVTRESVVQRIGTVALEMRLQTHASVAASHLQLADRRSRAEPYRIQRACEQVAADNLHNCRRAAEAASDNGKHPTYEP